MFPSITLRGTKGEILNGHRPAAALQAWTVSRTRAIVERPGGPTLQPSVEGWILTAKLGPQVDKFQLRYRGLRFTAPRTGGFWCWPVLTLTLGERTLRATLGPPEY